MLTNPQLLYLAADSGRGDEANSLLNQQSEEELRTRATMAELKEHMNKLKFEKKVGISNCSTRLYCSRDGGTGTVGHRTIIWVVFVMFLSGRI